ncbi:MAG: phosphoribosylformylglycinamidine synthase, partial [Anaerovorax sp.]
PLGGKYQLSPTVGMAAKLPVLHGDTDTATIMAYGFDPQLSKNSPFFGAMYAVIDSVTKLAAMGGDYSKARLTFQEYFEKLTEDPTTWGKPFSALLGALKVQKELEIAAIGGKDSMSGTFKDINVPPTLVSCAVGVVDADEVISTEFKKEGSTIVYMPAYRSADGTIDFAQYKRNMAKVRQLAEQRKILAANTIGKGGIFISLVKMCVGNKIGATTKAISEAEMYGESYGSLLLEIDGQEGVETLFEGTTGRSIGITEGKKILTIPVVKAEDDEELIRMNLDE